MRSFFSGLLALAFLMFAPVAYAQTVLQDGSVVSGHLTSASPPPVGVGCTIAAGSTDMAGACLTTATSGTITFAKPFATAPVCLVVDITATPVIVYTISTTAITLGTVTSAHQLRWFCMGNAGN